MIDLKNKRKRTDFIIVVILILTIPIWGPIVFLFVYIIGLSILSILFNNTNVWNSEYVGEKVTLAPFAIVTKMEKYGGWRDRYYYIFAKNSEAINQKSINEIGYYKVISEKRNINSSVRVCILENDKLKGQQISIDCDYISKINELASIYIKLKNDIKIEGKAYVASFGSSSLKPIFKVDNFFIYEVKNEEEIMNVILSGLDDKEEYEYVMDSKHLVYLKNAQLGDKNLISRLLNNTLRSN